MTTNTIKSRIRDGLPSAWNIGFYAVGLVTGVLVVYSPGTPGIAAALTTVAVVSVWALSFVGGIGIGLVLMHAAHTISLSQ